MSHSDRFTLPRRLSQTPKPFGLPALPFANQMPPNPIKRWIAILAASLAIVAEAAAMAPLDPEGEPDVVAIVDTSTTMRNPGMDDRRASLLLTKLLADIVPGRLAAIRLLDLRADAAALPRKVTGQKEPCAEDPSDMCTVVAPEGDWGQKARTELLGVQERARRGDPAFKKLLESHLAQVSNNSRFDLSFWAAKGVFDRHSAEGLRVSNRTVLWLSDGKDESRKDLPPALAALRADGVEIVAIVFGAGDPTIPERNGLAVEQVSTPAELMRAFAQAFRGILGAPYRIDNVLAASPEFRMREQVDEAWIVVYGDRTLSAATLDGPQGEVPADDAYDVWPSAGAYRVAHLRDPKPGTWRVHAQGGGPGTAYAVVQRSSLAPVLLEPQSAPAGIRVRLVAGVRAKGGLDVVIDPEVLKGATMRIAVEGAEPILHDDGRDADETAGDGRFSAWHSFRGTGTVPLMVSIESPVVRRSTQAQVKVGGSFGYRGGPIPIDFGQAQAPATVCRPLTLRAEHQGSVPFVLEGLRGLPAGHAFVLRAGGTALRTDGPPADLAPGLAYELCFESSASAPSSSANGEPWLRLRVADSQASDRQVELHLSWRLQGLTWWQRWGWLVLTLIGLLAGIFVALGYILPKRFQRTLSLTFAPELDDVDDTPPLALYTWRGVGIGFYRDARAYLHGDFRISGRGRGALAGLFAEAGGARVRPGKGMSLFRQDFGSAWEEISPEGETVRAGEVYRIGDGGPYFRIALRVGTSA